MISVKKDILSNELLDLKIRNNPLFQTTKIISKIFPKVGLDNSSEDTTLENILVKEHAITLLLNIKDQLTVRQLKLNKFIKKLTKISDKRNILFNDINQSLNILNNLILKRYQYFIECKANKLALKLPDDIVNIITNKLLFKSGQSIFKVYGDISNMLVKAKLLPLKRIELLPGFKEFSLNNNLTTNITVKFSSDGKDGAWDIATMSMRGITSCQSWGAQYDKCLIGSLLDPCAGIIYITEKNKKNMEYGSKMLYRSIVRFIYDDKVPSILIDKIYPRFNENVLNIFKSFLKKKLNNKINVIYGPNEITYNDMQKLYIPTNIKISNLSDEDRSYRDTKLAYRLNDLKSFKDKLKEIVDEKTI